MSALRILSQPPALPTPQPGLSLRALAAVPGAPWAGLDARRGLLRGAVGGLDELPGAWASARRLALSPDGRWLAVGTDRSVLRLSWPTGSLDREDPVPSGVTALAIDEDGRRVVGAGDARLWVDGPEHWGEVKAHGGRVVAVCRIGATVFSADSAGRVLRADLASGKGQVLGDAGRPVALLAENADAVLIGDEDGSLRRWVPAENRLEPLLSVDGPIQQLARQGDLLAIGHGSVTCFDLAAGRGLGLVPASRAPLVGLGFDGDRQLIAAGRASGPIALDPASAGSRPPWFGHAAGLRAFLPEGERIWTASRDGSLRAWATADGAPLLQHRPSRAGLQCIVQMPDGDLILADTGGRLQRFDPARRQITAQVQAHDGPVTALGRLPDSGLLVSGGADGSQRSWDEALRPLFARRDHEDRLRCLMTLPQDRVLTGSYDGTACLVNAFGGPVLARYAGHTRPVLGVLGRPDRVLTASLDGQLRAFSPDGALTGCLPVDEAGLVGLLALPQDRLLSLGRSGLISLHGIADLLPLASVQLGVAPDGAALGADCIWVGDQQGGVHRLSLDGP